MTVSADEYAHRLHTWRDGIRHTWALLAGSGEASTLERLLYPQSRVYADWLVRIAGTPNYRVVSEWLLDVYEEELRRTLTRTTPAAAAVGAPTPSAPEPLRLAAVGEQSAAEGGVVGSLGGGPTTPTPTVCGGCALGIDASVAHADSCSVTL